MEHVFVEKDLQEISVRITFVSMTAMAMDSVSMGIAFVTLDFEERTVVNAIAKMIAIIMGNASMGNVFVIVGIMEEIAQKKLVGVNVINTGYASMGHVFAKEDGQAINVMLKHVQMTVIRSNFVLLYLFMNFIFMGKYNNNIKFFS